MKISYLIEYFKAFICIQSTPRNKIDVVFFRLFFFAISLNHGSAPSIREVGHFSAIRLSHGPHPSKELNTINAKSVKQISYRYGFYTIRW